MAKRQRWSYAERETFWRQQIADCQESGRTIRAFCSERNPTESQFYLWKQNLSLQWTRFVKAMPKAATRAFVPVSVAGSVASPTTVELYDARLSIFSGR